MIENIRKFRIVIILGLALVALGLVLGMKDDVLRGGVGGQSILRLHGKTYHQREFQQMGPAAGEIIRSLASSGDFGLYMYAQALTGNATDETSANENFFVHRLLFRKAAVDFGIEPSDTAVEEKIRGMKAFSEGESGFSEQAYRNFIDRGIGRLGLTENDFRELVADYLSFERIRETVAPGLTENRDATARQYALENQKISGEIASLSIDQFEEEVKPDDAELKAYWELIRDRYMTEEKRAFSYVIIQPDPVDDAPAATGNTNEGDALSEDDKKKEKEEKSAKEAALAEMKRAKQFEADKLASDFSYRLEEQLGAGLEELAAEYRLEIRKADLFPRSAPPKALDKELRASSSGGNVADELFAMTLSEDPLSKLSQPIPLGENEWLIARLDEVKKSEQKSFEDAKDDVRYDYVREKASEKMQETAKSAAKKIQAMLKEGKPFAEAAKEAGLRNTKSLENIDSGYRADPASEPANLFMEGRYVNPGELAEVINDGDRAFLFLVKSRVVEKPADPEAVLDTEVKNTAMRNQYALLNDWLNAQVEAADLERLYQR